MVEMETDSTAVAVVRSIIAMAQALHKRLVAEGVETHRQVALLADWGCHEIQGYVYYRPMPPEQLGEELARLQAGRTVTS